MGETPDQIRQDIERTRAELSHDTDRLADRTSPRRIVDRRTQQVRQKTHDLRDRVMGSASHTSRQAADRGRGVAHSAQQTAGQAADAMRSAPERAVRETQGNPLAAGLIAFGAGLLAASVISESQAEQRAAQRLREQAGGAIEPVRQAATESAQRVKGQATESARAAGEQLKQSASEAAQTTGHRAQDDARSAAEEMRGS